MQVNELEEQRKELYIRYGFADLKTGCLPRDNPMSLFPISIFPSYTDPSIPPKVRPLIKEIRKNSTEQLARILRPTITKRSLSAAHSFVIPRSLTSFGVRSKVSAVDFLA